MKKELSINSGAIYSVQLQGVLDQSWVDQFGSLQAQTFQGGDPGRPPVTTVVGQVADQAALAGLLNLAYSLGMPLLSVTYLGSD
jgi:hypothetical protein